MDEDIIATLIQENDMHRISQAELQKTVDDLRLYSEELRENNEKMREYSKQLRTKLIEEEEISQVLSKRIEILEKEMYDVKLDFRSYVEKMQIYLQTEYNGSVKHDKVINEEPINEEPINKEPINEEPIHDEILYEKPHLSRSTNQHEWTESADILYRLDF